MPHGVSPNHIINNTKLITNFYSEDLTAVFADFKLMKKLSYSPTNIKTAKSVTTINKVDEDRFWEDPERVLALVDLLFLGVEEKVIPS